ncbi:type I restriction endonuclease subunit M [Comamonas testosteroni]|nr:type I restriction endonuclease subunit M [Comamonas testosteroni]
MSANSSRSGAVRRMTLMSNAPRFALGQLVATPGAMELLEQTGFSALALVSRHVHGDWGDCGDEDKATNEAAVRQRMRVMSVYRLVDAEALQQTPQDKRSSLPTLWIITASDRSVTTLLLPSEY